MLKTLYETRFRENILIYFFFKDNGINPLVQMVCNCERIVIISILK